jgi:general secretion pathway protein B
MSSILKALKKLEEEKAAKRSGQVDISRAILTEKPARSGRRTPVLVIGSSVLLAVVVLAGSVMLWHGRSTPSAGKLQANAPQLPAQPAPVKAAPLPQPAAKPSSTVPATPAVIVTRRPLAAVPSPPPLPTPTLQTPRQTSPVPLRQMPTAPIAKPLPVPNATPQPPVEAVAKPVPPPSAPQRQTVPALRVSGIAWQKDSASRLAIVNGQPVGLGVDVGGATVDEIFPDRVRFTYKGEKVEVGLGRSTKDD